MAASLTDRCRTGITWYQSALRSDLARYSTAAFLCIQALAIALIAVTNADSLRATLSATDSVYLLYAAITTLYYLPVLSLPVNYLILLFIPAFFAALFVPGAIVAIAVEEVLKTWIGTTLPDAQFNAIVYLLVPWAAVTLSHGIAYLNDNL